MLQKQKGSKKVRAGDTVVVIAGNNKGQHGKVLSCADDKVVVQGVNMCKKHVKRSEQNPKGGVVEMERPIHVSNVCPSDADGNALKVKVRQTKDEKELVFEKNGDLVVWRSMKRKG
jgi:large subunit ribosomal protein L24